MKLSNILNNVLVEETEYEKFFRNALEKAGKSIPSMSDEEKKEFFNKIDAAWKGKGEKTEGNEFGAERAKAIAKGEDEFSVDGKSFPVTGVDDEDRENAKAFVGEAKFGRGDQVRIKDRPKYVWDKQFWGKAGYIKNVIGKDILVTFPNGRTIVADPKDLEVVASDSINEASDDYDYAGELQDAVERALKGKNIKGWRLGVDSRSGTFEYTKRGIDLVIYATPMWDGNKFVPFNVQDMEGDDVDMIQRVIGNRLAFKPTYDVRKDVSNYISVITKTLAKVEQAYSKLNTESVVSEGRVEVAGISKFTGLREPAIEKFISNYNINVEKLFDFVRKGKLNDRMDVASAISGKPNNPIQKKMVKMFSESVVSEADEKVDLGLPFAVVRKGGSISSSTQNYIPAVGVIVSTFKNQNDAKQSAASLRKSLSQYDRKYYKTTYTVIKLTDYTKGLIKNKTESVVKEGASSEELRMAKNAVRNFARYRRVPGEQAIYDLMRALKDVEREYKKKKESVTEGKKDKEIKKLEAKLKSIKGNTPADQGIRAAIKDDIERLKNESINEGRGFVAAAKKAKDEGKTEFEYKGKTYPVTLKESSKLKNILKNK